MSTGPVFAPPVIAPINYNIALGPLKGSEKKFSISTGQSFALGQYAVTGQNAGAYTPSVPDNIGLAAAPSGLIAVLRTNIGNVDPVVLIVNGLDQNSQPLSGQAVFTPPPYAQDQTEYLPEGYGVDVTISDTSKVWSVVTGVSVVCDATALGTQIRLFGMPPLSTFVQIGYRVKLDYDSGVREPSPTRNGSDAGAFIKPGDRPVKSFTISGKIPTMADGLSRYNGIRLTGLCYEDKEDKIVTANEYFMGLIITVKAYSNTARTRPNPG